MPQLTVITEDNIRRIPFNSGLSVRQILEGAGIRIRSGCRGNGACGFCRIKIEEGMAGTPGPNELLILTSKNLEQRIRFACQLIPENDLSIRVLDESPKLNWRDLTPDYLACTPPDLSKLSREPSTQKACSLAIDLGTTHICLCLWDLTTGKRLYSRIGLNPQSKFGSDVVTRLLAAAESKEIAIEMARLPLEAVHEALLDICSRNGLSPEHILRISVVGNTPMIMLLTETDPQVLLQPNYWTKSIECLSVDSQVWVSELEINPKVSIEIVSPLAGFVGSDLLAGVLVTGMLEHSGSLLIDFGTNSEIALWDGNTLWVTSAAGGPAFEGCGIKCGMPAEPGAIYRVEAQPDISELDFQVIGSGQPEGFCGSGLVDLLAFLRRQGNLTAIGKLANLSYGEDFWRCGVNPVLRLTGEDVDLFQRAKAAIGVGVMTLLSRAGMRIRRLSQVYISGAFGQHLNIRNAQSIGLLPDVAPEKVKLCGNTALAGCEQLLVLPGKTAELATLRKSASIINLSQLPDFDNLFLENLYLQPLRDITI